MLTRAQVEGDLMGHDVGEWQATAQQLAEWLAVVAESDDVSGEEYIERLDHFADNTEAYRKWLEGGTV